MMRYAILGPVELREDGDRRSALGPRLTALLADLIVHANEAVSEDTLIDDIWGPRRSDGSVKSLQVAIGRLRAALGHGADGASPLLRTPGGYRLVVAPGELDSKVFEQCVQDASRSLREGDAATARETLRVGLELWRGPPLADVTYQSFARDEIRRLEERRLDALETYIDADLALGDYGDAIGRLGALVAEHPMRERLTCQLMLALYRSGRQQEALDAYQRTRARLHELGLEPGPALASLERQILTQDRALAAPAPEPPAALRSLPECVGRAGDKVVIREALATARSGTRTIVAIAGEPGLGKTLLASHMALDALREGFAIGWGASLESVRPPYGIWIAPLSQLVEGAGGGPQDEYLDRIIRLDGERSRSASLDPQGERYRLFNAVVRLLRQLTNDRPVLIGLDDLQWADSDSLALLDYVAREPADGFPLAIMATYRDAELEDPQRDLLADLYRVPGVTRHELKGLGVPDVAALMAARSEQAIHRASHRLIEQITAGTRGNPFFVVEIVRHLDESGSAHWHARSLAEVRRPQSVNEVVERRVRRLGPQARVTLSAAAVIGQEFGVDLLERLVEHDPLDVLEAAEQAALLLCREPGRYAFAHALVNHTLYDALSATRRQRTHGRIAEALEARDDADPGTLAHHTARSDLPDRELRAAGHAARAGERALALRAPDEAQRWFDYALGILRTQDGAEVERCDVLIGLGEAKRRVGDTTFRDNLLKAARIAARLGDLERLTRAVLANTLGPFGAAGGRPDPPRVQALEQALELVPKSWPQRPLMTAVLARELYYSGEPGRGSRLSVTALERAERRPTDRFQLARVMAMSVAIRPVAPLDDYGRRVDQLHRLADELGDPELRFGAASAEFIYGMHSGQPTPLAAGLQRMRALDDELHQPILHWTRLWAASAERTLAGDLTAGEALTTEAELDALRHGRPQARLVTFGQLLSIRTEQCELDDLRDRLEDLIATNPLLPVLRLARGFIDAETGHLDRAEAVLQRAASAGFAFPFDRTLAFSLARCADIAVRVGSRDVAANLYDRLLPYRDQFATPAGLSSRGSVELSLGRLATMLGRLDDAEQHLTRAHHAHEHFRAPLLQARSALALAQALLAHGRREPAEAFTKDAHDLATLHGSTAILRELQALPRPRALGITQPG